VDFFHHQLLGASFLLHFFRNIMFLNWNPILLDTADHYRRECEDHSKKEQVKDGLDTFPVSLKVNSRKSNHAAYTD